MIKVFFCYEKDFAGRWCPVAYQGEVKKLAKDAAGSRSTVWTVPADLLDETGMPKFDALMARHPAPAI